MDDSAVIKSVDAVNGFILYLSRVYETDSLPVFIGENSVNDVLDWMQLYRMSAKYVVVFRFLVGLIYSDLL